MLGLVGSARLRFVRWQSWRAALRGESKEKYGECENDPDATGTVARGDLRSQQQGGPGDAGQTGDHRGRGSEEEWRVRAARHRPTGTRGPQSPHGAQPGDWRGGKQMAYVGIWMLNFFTLVAMAVFVFQVPLKAGLLPLTIGALLYVVGTTGMGLLISA